MESAIESSPPFRIGSEPIQKDNSQNANNSNSQSPPTRVLVPGEGTDQWVCTMSQDFSTFTFAQVYQLFKAAVCDLKQNGLIVSRMVCNVPSPYEFRFSEDALKVLRTENAGGASEFSEAVSFEVFHRMFAAQLEKTEMDIRYDSWSKKTDYSVRMFDQKIAVSVTRAMKFRGVFTDTDAFKLLHKKLLGVQMSNQNVCEADRWSKQVLHIMCEHVYIVESLRSVFSWMSEHTPQLIGNTVVLITLTANTPFLYYNFCSEQANMQFHATDTPDCLVSNVASANTFTTPARKDTCSAPRFVAESEEDRLNSLLDFDIDEIGFDVPGLVAIPSAASHLREQTLVFYYYGFPLAAAGAKITIMHGALALRWSDAPEEDESNEQIWDNEQFLINSSKAPSSLPTVSSREVGMREFKTEGKPAKRGKMIDTTVSTEGEGEAEMSVKSLLPLSISFRSVPSSSSSPIIAQPNICEEKKEEENAEEDAFLAPKPRLLAAFHATFIAAKPAEAQMPKSEIFKSAGSESHAAVHFRGSVVAFIFADEFNQEF